jgi:uncharacterized protein with NRDE domain
MCVLAFAWKAHPRWHLVMAGNRDELHDRPAAALARWATPAGLIAGRDLQSGGTWAGVSEQGRFAVVTNLRGYGGPAPDRASRGALVTGLLASQGSYADPDTLSVADFNPFNLIIADHQRAIFLSNRPEPIRSELPHGLYGLSNGALDEPWPKTLRTRSSCSTGSWPVRPGLLHCSTGSAKTGCPRPGSSRQRYRTFPRNRPCRRSSSAIPSTAQDAAP